MKRYLKTFLATPALILALSVPSFAQVQTIETASLFEGSATSIATGRAFGQTFTSADQIFSATYRFASFTTTAAANLNVYFTQWNPNTNTAIGPALLSTTAVVPPSGSFSTFFDATSTPYQGYDLLITLNQALQSDLTYALILVGTSSTSMPSLTQATAAPGDNFQYGTGLVRFSGISTNLATGFTNLTSMALSQINDPGMDWGFSAISISIVPEPSAAAAALVAGFVGLMVIRRRLQRAKLQPVAVA
ncbi:MAG: hypothetical protein Q8M02_03915 [Candidatus Didemnitutus sp.]|nr:hypothetical protein [Candidatus Didemnitutus sp.]